MLAVLGVFAFGGWLVWLGEAESMTRGQRYVPALLRNGEVVQGHGE